MIGYFMNQKCSHVEQIYTRFQRTNQIKQNLNQLKDYKLNQSPIKAQLFLISTNKVHKNKCFAKPNS